MAALALKDVGIEVVAVGNGEAAVRKLREVAPDLVLADIFMPVRNGYEVCEFVKHDPQYSNTPVLLLAGAFDPFDEREAQRVQADGILKKPFVPPDPLINAVKTLLEKSAGERLMSVTVPADGSATAQAATPAESAMSAAPAKALEPKIAEPVAPPLDDAELKAYDEPLSVVDFLPDSIKNAAKEKPPSFSAAPSFEIPQLDEPEPVVTASRDPVLGEPAFWTPEEPEPVAAPAEEDSPEDLVEHTWGSSGRPAPMREDPDPPPMMLELEPPKPAAAIHEVELSGLAPVQQEPINQSAIAPAHESIAPELPEIELDSAPAATYADANHATTEASSYAPTEVGPAASPASAVDFAAPETFAPAAPPLHGAETSSEDTLPLPEAVVESTELEMTPLQNSHLPEVGANLPEVQPEALYVPGPAFFPVAPISVPGAAASEPDPIAKTEYEESPLLELEDSSPAFHDVSVPPAAPPTSEPQSAEPALEHNATELEVAGEWPPVFVPVTSGSPNETPKPATDVVLERQHPAAEPVPIQREATAEQAPEPATFAALSPEAQEAVIQRVIERMQPQIVELVTRQILRPLVESLVRDELVK